ncbi:MAG TPA: hypothetical protein VGW31_00735 [Hanamia sp.]|nr:hypothetical protein [Hanamia sp.]
MLPAYQFLFLALFILPAVFFIITLQNTLKAVSPENRKMPFANVWLLCIPLFNFYWQFVVVNKIAQSISLECEKLQIPVKETKPTYNLGLTWNICYILFLIPMIKLWVGIIIIPIWIVYWIKVNQYRKLIIQNQNSFLYDAERNIFHADHVL